MITPRWEFRVFGQYFGGAESRLAALPPQGVQESDELYLLSAAGANVKVRVGPDGHQGVAEGRCRRARAVAAGHEGRLSAARGRDGERVRRLAAAGAAAVRRQLHPRAVHRRIRRAGRGDPRGDGPQAAYALLGGRLPGRALRRGGQRQANAHHRRRVRGPDGGDPGHPRPRPRRLHEHVVPARPGGARRRRAGTLCGDRCRHQLGQVPHRRTRRPAGTGARSSTGRQ